MSQIETLLLFALGFSLATLIALFAGRVVWSAALKVGARRMQKQVPSSLVGLQTERDRLRAEYAMLSQRLSGKLDEVKLRMAEQMAEVSRQRNRVEQMTGAMKQRDTEVEALRKRLEEMAKELTVAATLQDEMRKALAARDAELAEAKKELAARAAGIERPASPAAKADSLHDRPVFKTAAGGEDRLKRRIDKLSEMAKSVARDRQAGVLDDNLIIAPAPEASGATSSDPGEPVTDPLVIDRLEEAERETEALRRELEQLDAEWEKRLTVEPGTPGEETPAHGVANVISLANRIKELKKGLTPS